MLMYRLVEGWAIAFGEHCSHKQKPLLTSSMNLELVSIPFFNYIYLSRNCIFIGRMLVVIILHFVFL